MNDPDIPSPHAVRGRELLAVTSNNRIFIGRLVAGTYYIPESKLPQEVQGLKRGEHIAWNGADIYRTKKINTARKKRI